MNEVYLHTEATHKEQPKIRLWHTGGESNGCCRQPILLFVEVEGKFIAKTRQHIEEQFAALEDQLETSPTQISNVCGHNGNGLETLLRSAKRTDVNTMHKLMPLGGWTGSNSIFQNSKGIYNLKNSWIM
jgi:hypothetical protein